jgi:hypothetical protein
MPPEPTGVFTISLDFELFWGERELSSLEARRSRLMRAREAVPALLQCFQDYDIHATWAVVGFLFFETRAQLLTGLPSRLPNYDDPGLSPYPHLREIGENEDADPYHFAPSLINRILRTPHQELATHTFSHFYCLEAGQGVEDFRADLQAARRVSQRYGVKLESLVFPRNQVNPGYLPPSRELGIVAYRGNEHAWFYQGRPRGAYRQVARRGLRLLDSYIGLSGPNTYPIPPAAPAPVNLAASRYMRPYSRFLRGLEPLRLHRITSAMKYAATHASVYHLWWHPEDFGVELGANIAFLRRVLGAYKELQQLYQMSSLTMSEIAHLADQSPTG